MPDIDKNLIIRDFLDSDYENVLALWMETDMGGAYRGDNLYIINNTIKNGGKLLILENCETKELIGTSWLTNDHRRIYLHHFAIKPQYQGKGLSHKLVEESIEFAKQKKLQIKLEVHENNITAKELYKKHGFTYLGDYRVYIIREYK